MRDVGDGYLFVQKGLLFVTDRDVPLNAIDHVDADGVYLNVTQDRLDSVDWSAAPTPGTPGKIEAADETIFAHPRTAAAADTRGMPTRTRSIRPMK